MNVLIHKHILTRLQICFSGMHSLSEREVLFPRNVYLETLISILHVSLYFLVYVSPYHVREEYNTHALHVNSSHFRVK